MNTVRSMQKHLEMFQQTFSNALDQTSPLAPQPHHIKTPLRIHQLTSLEDMRRKEMSLGTGYIIPGTQDTLFSKFAILGDRVGVGKTLMVLGHISQMSSFPLQEATRPSMSNLSVESTHSCYSIHPSPPSENKFDSLIVVPHTIYRQWETEVKNTSLKAHFIKTRRDLDKDNIVKSLRESHLTLISSTLLASLLITLKGRNVDDACWRRVFYDEADTIKIVSTCPHPVANITWYVSASYPNLLFMNQYYHSHIIRQLPQSYFLSLNPELQGILQAHIDAHPVLTFFRIQSEGFFKEHLKTQHHLRAHLVVRNSEEFINQSIQLPTLHREIILCQAPRSQQLVEQMLPSEVASMLNAGDIQGALQSLGVSSHTPLTIVEAATEFRKRDLERLKRVLEFKQDMTYSTPQVKEAALDTLRKKIADLEQIITTARDRIENASKESCSICFDNGTDPVITPCCSKVFCGSCILSWMVRSPACPLCRTSFHPSALKAIGAERPAKPEMPKKLEALLKIFHDNEKGKFLVFSRYENPFTLIQENVQGQFSVALVQGNKDAIANKVAEFEAGRLNILLMNSRHAAAGLNLPSATHVILLHRMIGEEEKQIMGRAYRMGRTEPLHFIQLLHERE